MTIGRGRYRVDESHQFNQDWSQGVAEGWINPMADPSTLAAIKEILATRPQSGQAQPGLPANVRFYRFPRSAAYDRGRLILRYSVIEDDRAVMLERLIPVP